MIQKGYINITVFLWTIDDVMNPVDCNCVIETSVITTNSNCSACSYSILRNRKYNVKVRCENDIGTSESTVATQIGKYIYITIIMVYDPIIIDVVHVLNYYSLNLRYS